MAHEMSGGNQTRNGISRRGEAFGEGEGDDERGSKNEAAASQVQRQRRGARTKEPIALECRKGRLLGA